MRLVLPLTLLLLAGCAHTQSGILLKGITRRDSSDMPSSLRHSESTAVTYISGANVRSEYESPAPPHAKMASIVRCDDHVVDIVNLDTREYEEASLPSSEPTPDMPSEPANILVDTTAVDKGETKNFFGFTARHYVKTRRQTAAPELKLDPSETVIDAWYIEAPEFTRCLAKLSGSERRFSGVLGDLSGKPPIHPEFRYHGPDPQGLVVSSKTVTRATKHYVYGDAYQTSSTVTSEIVDLKRQRLDPGLFQVPKGFTKVKNFTTSGK